MSFTSTYNSLSVRDWQATGSGQNFFVGNTTSTSDAVSVQATNNCQYIVTGEEISGGRVRTYTRNLNNSLTLNGNFQVATYGGLVFTPDCLDISRTSNSRIIVGDDSVDLASPTRTNVGVAQVRNFSNGSIIFEVLGNANNQRYGTSVTCNDDAEIIAIHNGGSTPNIQIYSNASGNYTLRDTITVPTRSTLYSIDMDDSGNTLVYGSHTTNEAYVYEYNGNTWSNTALVPTANTANFGVDPRINSYGNIIIVNERGTYTPNIRGRLHIFAKSGNTWNETAVIDPEDYGITTANTVIMNDVSSISDDGLTVVCSLSNNFVTSYPLGIQIYKGNGTNYELTQTIGNANTSDTLLGYWNVLSDAGNVIVTSVRTTNGANTTGNVVVFVS